MTADEMAAVHARAFDQERAWNAAEFSDLLDSPFVQAFTHDFGFALTRSVAGETELLTLAVDPGQRRKGIARRLLCRWLDAPAQSADTAFLEVAADNTAAIALYLDLGFATIATRPAYYARKNGSVADALIMQRALTFGQVTE
jgi:ribosomal-protein-alanine N-acetyltransferase